MKSVFMLAIFLAMVTTAYADAQPTQDCTYLGNDLKRHPGIQQYVEGMGWDGGLARRLNLSCLFKIITTSQKNNEAM